MGNPQSKTQKQDAAPPNIPGGVEDGGSSLNPLSLEDRLLRLKEKRTLTVCTSPIVEMHIICAHEQSVFFFRFVHSC
jgi:hypothetical protein